MKKKSVVNLDKIAKSTAILASNTSSISITRLASATSRPQQVMLSLYALYESSSNNKRAGNEWVSGLGKKLSSLKLVEIVRGADTSDNTFYATKALAERQLTGGLNFEQKNVVTFGKIVICSQDFSGFVVIRILMPMVNEAFHALYTGVATKEDIETGMKLGTNHPMGPLELADFIGLDVCLSIMRVLHAGLGDGKYSPCPLLVQYVDAGRLGKKRGIGVYDYRKMPESLKPSSRL
ncbi:hypothetical protein SLEP1_g46230 [Rubroshorea leprosula]|uniref:3-hydroxybutyryl-CoA dehydrogenase n=1 Tax=Rubroshorea leprosula TaxID=152421 RepID=A0AAV5LNH7_9ROSI|nr:hypothetical protein SLEP1_g46230 [Rubroshorea leprosula]